MKPNPHCKDCRGTGFVELLTSRRPCGCSADDSQCCTCESERPKLTASFADVARGFITADDYFKQTIQDTGKSLGLPAEELLKPIPPNRSYRSARQELIERVVPYIDPEDPHKWKYTNATVPCGSFDFIDPELEAEAARQLYKQDLMRAMTASTDRMMTGERVAELVGAIDDPAPVPADDEFSVKQQRQIGDALNAMLMRVGETRGTVMRVHISERSVRPQPGYRIFTTFGNALGCVVLTHIGVSFDKDREHGSWHYLWFRET